MTELEYIICEAERCGEINLNTRNEMLGIITEKKNGSARVFRVVELSKKLRQ